MVARCEAAFDEGALGLAPGDLCAHGVFNEGGEAFVVFEYRFGCFAKVWVYAKRRQGGGLGGGAIASHLRCRLHPAVRDFKCGCSYGCGRSRAVGRGTPTQIGRRSCGARGCPALEITVVAGTYKKKT